MSAQSVRPKSSMMVFTRSCLSAEEWCLGLRRKLALKRRFSLTLSVPIKMSSWNQMMMQINPSPVYNVKGYVCICVPEPHRQSWASGQRWQLCHSPRHFPGAVQLDPSFLPVNPGVCKEDKKYPTLGGLCMWMGRCFCICRKTSYEVLPLPVAPMMAFIPGLMIPLQRVG